MGILETFAIESVHHFAPLHYLPFIVRQGALLSKPLLAQAGFAPSHYRSMSHRQDSVRGFDAYVHLTITPHPPIVGAKLGAGFPHIRLSIPSSYVDNVDFVLCRFNIAMTRYLRRADKPGFPESPTNGRYYDRKQIPVAKTVQDKHTLLSAHLSRSMIEVLVESELTLPAATTVACYSEDDAIIVRRVLQTFQCPWTITIAAPQATYNRNPIYASQVLEFIDRALDDHLWRGNGLEFDRV